MALAEQHDDRPRVWILRPQLWFYIGEAPTEAAAQAGPFQMMHGFTVFRWLTTRLVARPRLERAAPVRM